MNLTLHVWRQKSRAAEGAFVTYKAADISPDASFLEMLDIVNEALIEKGEEAIHFEHDCREGICGSCGMMINGVAHGPMGGTATCQLHMRHFSDGDAIRVEPWRARAFPVIKDLIVDRAALGEPLVDDVEHLQKRGIGADVLGLVGDELPFGRSRGLPPDL